MFLWPFKRAESRRANLGAPPQKKFFFEQVRKIRGGASKSFSSNEKRILEYSGDLVFFSQRKTVWWLEKNMYKKWFEANRDLGEVTPRLGGFGSLL